MVAPRAILLYVVTGMECLGFNQDAPVSTCKYLLTTKLRSTTSSVERAPLWITIISKHQASANVAVHCNFNNRKAMKWPLRGWFIDCERSLAQVFTAISVTYKDGRALSYPT